MILAIGNNNYIPLNANNTHGAPLVNGIPTPGGSGPVYDYNVTPMTQWVQVGPQQIIDDPDLIEVTVSVDDMGQGGQVWFQITGNNGQNPGIRLWQERSKQHGITGTYGIDPLNPTFTFYIEGVAPSQAVGDITIMTIFAPMMGGFQEQTTQQLTVTPFITSFGIRPKDPPTTTILHDSMGAVSGVNSGSQAANGYPAGSGDVGVIFTSSVNKSGLDATTGDQSMFIQNVTGVTNGANNQGAGLTLGNPTPGSYNWVIAHGQQGETFPLLDYVSGPGMPASPEYISTRVSDQNAENLTATDTPYLDGRNKMPGYANLNFANATSVYVTVTLRLYLVWKYYDGTLFTLATYNWQVIFHAALDQNGKLAILADSVTSKDPNGYDKISHEIVKKLNGTTYNTAMDWK